VPETRLERINRGLRPRVLPIETTQAYERPNKWAYFCLSRGEGIRNLSA
jgi:hypothetical protein